MIKYDTQFATDAGEFYVPETRRWFTFKPTTDAWALQHELIHEVDVIDGVRYAVVRKGIAYVAVDENEYGYPILERWDITKRNLFKH